MNINDYFSDLPMELQEPWSGGLDSPLKPILFFHGCLALLLQPSPEIDSITL